MNNKEKIKDIYEKLECFHNPTIQELAQELKQAYQQLYILGVDDIVKQQCREHNVTIQDVLGSSRRKNLVHIRYKVSKQAYQMGFTQEEIGNALNRDSSTIRHYLHEYQPI